MYATIQVQTADTLALTITLSPLDSNAAGKLIVFALLCVFLCPFLVRARGQLAPHSKAIRPHIREDRTGVQQLEMLKMWTLGIWGLVCVVLMQQLSDVPCVVAQEETPCTPLMEAISRPGYTVFAKIFQASNVSLEGDKPYTVFVPADGTAETLGGESGSFGILGLFTTYGINVTTVESIQSSELFPQISGFMGYYVVSGAYTMENLRSRSESNHLVTLFDTSSGTCKNPGETPSQKLSDGDLKIGSKDGQVVLTDDSTRSVQAVVLDGDIPACSGSVVHLIEGVLNPCCNSDTDDCTTAELDPKQVEVEAGGSFETEETEPPGDDVVNRSSSALKTHMSVYSLLGLLALFSQ